MFLGGRFLTGTLTVFLLFTPDNPSAFAPTLATNGSGNKLEGSHDPKFMLHVCHLPSVIRFASFCVIRDFFDFLLRYAHLPVLDAAPVLLRWRLYLRSRDTNLIFAAGFGAACAGASAKSYMAEMAPAHQRGAYLGFLNSL